jgi:hypothetical protein
MDTLTFEHLTSNIAILMECAPDTMLITRLWGTISLATAQIHAWELGTNIELAKDYLANPIPGPMPSLINLINEFQEARDITSWNDLNLEDKVKDWEATCKRDIVNLKRNTARHVSRISLELAELQRARSR